MSYLERNVCPFVKGSEQFVAWKLVQYMPEIFHVSPTWVHLYVLVEDAVRFNNLMKAVGLDYRLNMNWKADGRVFVCALDKSSKKKFNVHIRQLKRLAAND